MTWLRDAAWQPIAGFLGAGAALLAAGLLAPNAGVVAHALAGVGAGITVFAIVLLTSHFWLLRNSEATQTARGVARIFNIHFDAKAGWHGAIRLEPSATSPNDDPVPEGPCEVDLTLIDVTHLGPMARIMPLGAISGQPQTSQALVGTGVGGGGYGTKFMLAIDEKPMDVRIVDRDLQGVPMIGDAQLILVKDHSYILEARVTRGLRELGRHTYDIVVDTNNVVSLQER